MKLTINNTETKMDLSKYIRTVPDWPKEGIQFKDITTLCKVHGPFIKGYIEPSCAQLQVGDVVQFERFGFVRLDEITSEGIIFYFAHK